MAVNIGHKSFLDITTTLLLQTCLILVVLGVLFWFVRLLRLLWRFHRQKIREQDLLQRQYIAYIMRQRVLAGGDSVNAGFLPQRRAHNPRYRRHE